MKILIALSLLLSPVLVLGQTAGCNSYNLNWYRGYYSESDDPPKFPIKVEGGKVTFGKHTTERGVTVRLINFRSSLLKEGVPRYEVGLIIPDSMFRPNSEISITDNDLTEAMEGAVARFRYSIGVDRQGKDVGDNFWSNHTAAREKIVGKIVITSISEESVSGKFNFTAYANGFGFGEDEARKKYAELTDGCFTAVPSQ